jgi:hypothetical protein
MLRAGVARSARTIDVTEIPGLEWVDLLAAARAANLAGRDEGGERFPQVLMVLAVPN